MGINFSSGTALPFVWRSGTRRGFLRLDNERTAFDNYNKLYLFRSGLRYTVNPEREIHDWLWFGIEASYRQNLRFNLTNRPRARAEVIISNGLEGTPLVNAGIFVVPPWFSRIIIVKHNLPPGAGRLY